MKRHELQKPQVVLILWDRCWHAWPTTLKPRDEDVIQGRPLSPNVAINSSTAFTPYPRLRVRTPIVCLSAQKLVLLAINKKRKRCEQFHTHDPCPPFFSWWDRLHFRRPGTRMEVVYAFQLKRSWTPQRRQDEHSHKRWCIPQQKIPQRLRYMITSFPVPKFMHLAEHERLPRHR